MNLRFFLFLLAFEYTYVFLMILSDFLPEN